MSEEIDYKSRYERAAKQRFIALKNAFNTIREFAEPSLDPKKFSDFEDIEKYLLENYGQDTENNSQVSELPPALQCMSSLFPPKNMCKDLLSGNVFINK
jgi:hypothetical protein